MSPRLLQLDQVSLHLPDGRVLFEHLNHSFNSRITGLVGANGCGKSLLGRLLAGRQAPTRGTVRREGRIYRVAQSLEPARYPTVAALAGVAPVLAALERIAQGSVEEEDHALAVDQWDCATRLEAELDQMGLGRLKADSPTETLSGGERQRVALLGAWLSRADWLVLDEPSNHLDTAQQRALAQRIYSWPNGLVLISHDRGLLEHVSEVVELSARGLSVYGGSYSQYAAAREQEQQAFQSALQGERAQAKRERRESILNMERRQRRNARGDRQARHGNQSKLITDAQKERSENSQGKLRLNQQVAQEQRQQRIAEARARCVPELQRVMLSPDTVVPPRQADSAA